jgi:hypothetical protein
MRGGEVGMVGQLARFAGALRDRGVRVGLGDELDAAAALRQLDLLDRAEVHLGLRIALKVPRSGWHIFDELFGEYWDGGANPRRVTHPAWPREARRPMEWRWDGMRVRLIAPDEDEAPAGDTPSFSPDPMLRRKPFDLCSRTEIAALEELIRRLAPRLPARRTRRLVPTRSRGAIDLRRSFRHALRSDGDLLRLARRARAIEDPRLVVLYDTSGSMDGYTRLLLAFAFALRRAMRKVEIFAFNTSLVCVTREITPGDFEATVDRLAARVPDWSGGTRIGECLEAFNACHLDRTVDRRTTVLIFSDGLDQGDGAVLGRAMRALRERAARIVWLNPLLGDPRYRPSTEAMCAAMPYIDHFHPAHNVESFETLLRVIP